MNDTNRRQLIIHGDRIAVITPGVSTEAIFTVNRTVWDRINPYLRQRGLVIENGEHWQYLDADLRA